ncbi:hypothetical protein, partial [Halobellus rufus]|uniref:hypothetical protein n=1 Tax=Halobellus rufus TaxID=1448860 RepID=UPI001E2B2631
VLWTSAEPTATDVVASRRTGNALAARSGRVGARCWMVVRLGRALARAHRALAKARARARRRVCRVVVEEIRDVAASRCRARERLQV